jgi:hypothetical protein
MTAVGLGRLRRHQNPRFLVMTGEGEEARKAFHRPNPLLKDNVIPTAAEGSPNQVCVASEGLAFMY